MRWEAAELRVLIDDRQQVDLDEEARVGQPAHLDGRAGRLLLPVPAAWNIRVLHRRKLFVHIEHEGRAMHDIIEGRTSRLQSLLLAR
jgi:hypothetical protein